jgi:hypothetical protein
VTDQPKPPTDDELRQIETTYGNRFVFQDGSRAATDVQRLVTEVRRLREMVLPTGLTDQDVRELEAKADAARGHQLTIVDREKMTPMDVFALLAIEEAPSLMAELRRLRGLIRRAVTPENGRFKTRERSCPTLQGRCWYCQANLQAVPAEPHTVHCPWPALLLEGTR